MRKQSNPPVHSLCTGRFVIFSVIVNIYNKKTKGPNLMELFTATRKLKRVFFFWQLQLFDVCTAGDTAHIDTIFKFLPHTRVNVSVSIFFTAAMIREIRSARSCSRVPSVLLTKHTLHSNHRLTRVIFQHTKRLLPTERPFSHYIHSRRLAVEMLTTMKKNLLGGKKNWVVPSICTGLVTTCRAVFL